MANVTKEFIEPVNNDLRRIIIDYLDGEVQSVVAEAAVRIVGSSETQRMSSRDERDVIVAANFDDDFENTPIVGVLVNQIRVKNGF